MINNRLDFLCPKLFFAWVLLFLVSFGIITEFEGFIVTAYAEISQDATSTLFGRNYAGIAIIDHTVTDGNDKVIIVGMGFHE